MSKFTPQEVKRAIESCEYLIDHLQQQIDDAMSVGFHAANSAIDADIAYWKKSIVKHHRTIQQCKKMLAS